MIIRQNKISKIIINMSNKKKIKRLKMKRWMKMMVVKTKKKMDKEKMKKKWLNSMKNRLGNTIYSSNISKCLWLNSSQAKKWRMKMKKKINEIKIN